jgi:hypothetical protein
MTDSTPPPATPQVETAASKHSTPATPPPADATPQVETAASKHSTPATPPPADASRPRSLLETFRNILTPIIAVLGFVVALAGLLINKSNPEANRAIAEWNQERAKAALQWDDPVELLLLADGFGRLWVQNDSGVEAMSLEVRRTRLFYSPTCKAIFYSVGHTWTRRERIAPHQGIALTLYEPFKISQATLSQPRGECARLPTGELLFSGTPHLNEDLVLGAPVDFLQGVGGLPEAMAKQLSTSPVCSTAAPCQVVEHIRATALHGKSFERRIFEEFYLNTPDGHWKSSEQLGAPGASSFRFADQETKILFIAVAEWIKRAKEWGDAFRPTGKPFRIGIWAATGVEPPTSPDGEPSRHSN